MTVYKHVSHENGVLAMHHFCFESHYMQCILYQQIKGSSKTRQCLMQQVVMRKTKEFMMVVGPHEEMDTIFCLHTRHINGLCDDDATV